jgi:hypothetical protein
LAAGMIDTSMPGCQPVAVLPGLREIEALKQA